jgi:hypothetical protein
VEQLKSKLGLSSRYGETMPGAIILVLILLGFPVVVGLSSAALAGVLGHLLWKDAEVRNEGSELLDTNI